MWHIAMIDSWAHVDKFTQLPKKNDQRKTTSMVTKWIYICVIKWGWKKNEILYYIVA